MNTHFDPSELNLALARACEHLRSLRTEHGHWEGELSSSALSTATAVCALDAYRRAADSPASSYEQLASLVAGGRRWLVDNQNTDGGWGDTTLSFSNISTTALCWAAMAGADAEHRSAVAAAEAWLLHAAGALDPPSLASAIRQRYGKDHTFSVPILTTLALTGRLGDDRDGWRQVPQLPFELAACPHRWFAWLQLPVVSYALPALIAMGRVRHHQRPTGNPLLRVIRAAVKRRTLRVLRSIQPSSGGFLEATPLTSFVALSLVGAGQAAHPVVRHAVDFLIRSVRSDGSWPIDTNLATWVTTLSISALHHGASPIEGPQASELRRWILDQQYHVEHPYTHAAPGGWAWTDLPGGVPDADDTPGALLALKTFNDNSHEMRDAASAGIGWLLDLQNADGGMPTFCRGWGTLPFDRSAADLTAHAIRAWLAWRPAMPIPLQASIRRATQRALDYLARTQRPDGAWQPLWFGNQHVEEEINLTYGTSRVLLALAALTQQGDQRRRSSGASSQSTPYPDQARAVDWLLRAQNDDGGWGGAAQTPSTIEETALAVEALAAICEVAQGDTRQALSDREAIAEPLRRGARWLMEHTDHGNHFSPSPIGFYFAKLWYFEQLYPVCFTVAALGRTAAVSDQLAPQTGIPAGADS